MGEDGCSHAADGGEEEGGEEEAGQEEGREEGCEEAQEEGCEEAEEEEEEEGEEGEEEEEEGEEGALRRRQAREGPAQEQGCDRGREEERLEAKGGWEGHLQGPHVQRRSGGHHGQGQDDHRSDCEGCVGLYQGEEVAQQAYHHAGCRSWQGDRREDDHVQDEQGSLQAREVSAHSCGRCRRRFRFSATCRGHRQRAFACRGKERLSRVLTALGNT